MLTESILYTQTYNTDSTITIKQYNSILKDGIEISRSDPHTHTICPGQDYSNEDADTQAMCQLFWTEDVIVAYQELLNGSN